MFYKIVIGGFRLFYGLLYNHKVEWEFDPKELPGAALIAPNHVSYLDPQLVAASWPEDLHFFAAKRLFRTRIMKWILEHLCCHPVEKGKELATIRTALELLSQGYKIVVFPEGTRSEGGGLQPLRSGVAFLAVQSGCPIVPCYVGGSYKAWPKTRKRPRFWGVQTVCRFGRPIWPTDEHGNTRSKKELNDALQHSLEHLAEQDLV